jgi:hypothetical protein
LRCRQTDPVGRKLNGLTLGAVLQGAAPKSALGGFGSVKCRSRGEPEIGATGRDFGFDTRFAREDMTVTYLIVAIALATGSFIAGTGVAFADGSGDPAAVRNDDGRYYDKEGNPT